jgi:ABC-type branched-subunit amino acid transport system ATPase component
VQAVKDVSFCIERGEVFAFLGPNGAGKTTTVRMLCTLTRPGGGHASVAGFDVARQPQAVRRRIGLLRTFANVGMPGWPAESAGRRVLVERRGWVDDDHVAALRSAAKDVRQCPGPSREAGRACPLVTSGRCRLAEEADLIVSRLPATDPDCAAVLAAHRRRWPRRLAQ